MAQQNSQLIHLIWYDDDDSAVCDKIDKLVKEDWLLLGLLGINEVGRLIRATATSKPT